MALVRVLLGDRLRHRRLAEGRTLRDVSAQARVSLGYLSEVERGHKEASSELLASICDALDIRLSTLLGEVSADLALHEIAAGLPAPAGGEGSAVPAPLVISPAVPVGVPVDVAA